MYSRINYVDLHCVCAVPRAVKKISQESNVRGVTSVDDELFVLLERDNNQISVYSTNDYKLLRHLNLPRHYDYNDITSCVRHKCLYMSDGDYRCVHRYNLRSTFGAKMKRLAGSRISRWPVPGKPCSLSVTPSCNLLVTCQGEPNKLVELSADGQRVSEIALQSSIECPWHSVQLTTGQFVVCHSGAMHQVCEVGADGKVTRSYGGQCGSGAGQLNYPRYLVVGIDSQFIFVVDQCNERVVLLSPTLEFIRYVAEGLPKPHRLYCYRTNRRMFVGQECGDVAVIQL